ncbi:nucleotide disphospho-sugar-binding domain-containing protein [Streptomyces sp. NPDC012637]|uniref:nucleotide disphospho-sugar-binding domain-containing protein n=1 Tax=Streptomyces sp. NPDC012637 TaxID=3364842 RepID=UPI0036EDCB8E
MQVPTGAHIALMSVPLHGHVNPMLGLATELKARGHRVTFATGEDFAPLVEEAGATAVGYRSGFPSARGGAGDWIPAEDDGTLAVAAFDRECRTALPQLAEAYAQDVPELVVYDTVTGCAPLLARRWGAAEVQFSPTHAFPDAVAGPAVGAGRAALDGTVPCVVAMPRSLQFRAEEISGRHVFVGPVGGPRRTDGDWAPPRPGRRCALVSLGTTYNRRTDVFRTCVRALRGLGDDRHVVVATGHPATTAELGDLAGEEGVEVHTWVPQQRVLRHTDVFLTAGGTGSVLEGLAHGVPLVVLPQAVEQFVTAERVSALGVGRVLRTLSAAGPDAADEQALTEAVRDLLADDSVPSRLSALRAEAAAAGGARAAADVVEAALARRTELQGRRGRRNGQAGPGGPGHQEHARHRDDVREEQR